MIVTEEFLEGISDEQGFTNGQKYLLTKWGSEQTYPTSWLTFYWYAKATEV